MMEVTPHLKSVLKNYQHSATKSLQGPGLALVAPKSEPPSPDLATEEESYLPTAPFPVQQLPILTTPDTSCTERTETTLEGETIACFVVGGEKRLCLPQVLRSVLCEFSWQQINQECDQLQIYCSRCTPEQLNLLKNGGILPSAAASSGLITKTDAERLCSALMHGQGSRDAPQNGAATAAGGGGGVIGVGGRHHHRKLSVSGSGGCSFAVYHKCFGKCRGVCYPELYTSKTAKCIECTECQGAFSPQQFVCHVHRQYSENRTVHWGFDSANWRTYLRVAKEQSDQEQCKKYLDEIKDQYDGKIPFAMTHSVYAGIKRKQVLASEIIKDHDLPLKKQKLLAEYLNPPVPQFHNLYGVYLQQYMHDVANRHLSAFKPVNNKEAKIYNLMTINNNNNTPPNRYTAPSAATVSDPPILQNPERVVPISESERFERTFQPNVALAPPTPKKHRYGKTFIKQELDIKKEEDFAVVIKQEPVEVDVVRTPPPLPPVEKQQAVSVVRYNPEIELSTDTEDSASDTSEKSLTHPELAKFDDILKCVDGTIRARLVDAFKGMIKERERLEREAKEKDQRIEELEKQLSLKCNGSVMERLHRLNGGTEEDVSTTTVGTNNANGKNEEEMDENDNGRVGGGGDVGDGAEKKSLMDVGGSSEDCCSSKNVLAVAEQTSVIAVVAAEPKAIINTAPE